MSTEATPAIDPVVFLRDMEATWQSHDGPAAAAIYADDAVMLYGDGLERRGEELRSWPARWFEYAADLEIHKALCASSGDCLVSEWSSDYTHPRTGRRMRERGAEVFWLNAEGKVYLHHMYEHTWPEGQQELIWPTVSAEDAVFRAVASGNVFEETLKRLVDAIKIGTIAHGERFPPERELAPRLGISRVTLREAMRALEQAGYAKSRRGRTGGTFVVYQPRYGPSERTARRLVREMGDSLLDALDHRRVIECGTAELAAERANRAAIERLQGLAHQAAQAGNGGYRAADVRFHLAIAEIAGSPSVAAAVADVQMQLTDLLTAAPRLELALQHANDQHFAIIAAIDAGNVVLARETMAEHLDTTAGLIRRFLA